MEFFLIKQEFRKNFLNVLPNIIEITENRVAVAAIDEEGNILGCISYILSDMEYIIDWLYVEATVRRKGVGTSLIKEVINAVTYTGLVYPIVARFEYSSDNTELYSFFSSIEMMSTEYSHDRYYLNAQNLKDATAIHSKSDASKGLVMFFDLPEVVQRKIIDELAANGSYYVADYKKWKNQCEQPLCRCIYSNNSLIDLIIIQRLSDGNLELSYLYSKNPKGLLKLLAATVSSLENDYPDTELSFDVVNEGSGILAEHLFLEARVVPIYEALY